MLGLEPTLLESAAGLMTEVTEVANKYQHRVDRSKVVSKAYWNKERAAAAGAVEDAIQRSIAGDPIRALFGDVKCKQGLVRRSSLGLESIHPTHPQAEVLLEGTIPPQFIRGVLFPDEAGRSWSRRKLTKMEHPWKHFVHPAAFGRRADWQFWTQASNG